MRRLGHTLTISCTLSVLSTALAFAQTKEVADNTLTNRTGKWDVVIAEYPSAAKDTTGTPAVLSFSPNGVYRLWVKGDTTFRQTLTGRKKVVVPGGDFETGTWNTRIVNNAVLLCFRPNKSTSTMGCGKVYFDDDGFDWYQDRREDGGLYLNAQRIKSFSKAN